MTRLFLSLYLFIALSLVVLSAALNHVFFDANQPSAEQQNIIHLLTSLHQQKLLSQQDLALPGFRVRQLPLADIAFAPSDKQQLRAGAAVVLYDQQRGTQVYLQNEATVTEVTLPVQLGHEPNYGLYSGAFFVLLGGLIALWLWPLWSDLQKLQRAARNIDPNADFTPVELDNRSVVQPIAAALNDLGNRVKELLNTQRELTGAVAHEFRTPLSRLKFALAASAIPAGQAQAMDLDINELESLVQEMLSYTSMETQQPELNISTIPLKSLCEQRIQHLLPALSASLKVSIEGQDLMVLGDEYYLQRCIDNLVNNACRYAQQQLHLSVAMEQQQVVLSVADDGPGIAASYHQKVFEPFFRPDQGRDRKRGGAGLGLAIVKRIMHWHQGKCWVENAASGGACFKLAFKPASTA